MNRTLLAALAAAFLLACGTSDTGGNPDATAVPVGNDGSTHDFSTGESTGMFVIARSYESWRKEAMIHESSGPHSDVRTFFNDKYADAWTSGAFPMPVGAMSVKELYQGTDPDGWAVSVKTAEGSGKETWTWYETLSAVTDPKDYDFFGVAHPTCEGCHSGSSRDYSLAPAIP
jgi:hypothetical protein